MDLFDIRKNYLKGHLSEEDLSGEPIKKIEKWLYDAEQAECLEHSAIVLSTVSQGGSPSSRVVLLKYIDNEGLYFFTNYNSRKGQQITANNQGAILMFWPELERQVNIEGTIEKTSKALSDKYFEQRPLPSRVSAVVSQQSQVIDSRTSMDEAREKAMALAKTNGISRPDYWGGYVLKPHHIEFWQGGAHRFHDRILFEKKQGEWHSSRLMP